MADSTVASKSSSGNDQLFKRMDERRDVTFDLADPLARGGIIPGKELLHERKESKGVHRQDVHGWSQVRELRFAVVAGRYAHDSRRSTARTAALLVTTAVAALTDVGQVLERAAQCANVVQYVTPAAEQPAKASVWIREKQFVHDGPSDPTATTKHTRSWARHDQLQDVRP